MLQMVRSDFRNAPRLCFGAALCQSPYIGALRGGSLCFLRSALGDAKGFGRTPEPGCRRAFARCAG